ncbi:MAG: glycerol-3-phosphate dehydrogenase/oxidase, partial [Candidatus Binatia bacterium]
KGDFASGTSSKSSKLIHGGVRYLEQGELALVLESSRERDLLRRRLAPHLVRPLAFFFPVYRDGPVGLWKLRAGLFTYDVLAAFRNIRRHRAFRAPGASRMEPMLRTDGLRGGALYYDCITDDARLVLETVLAAETAGAICLNYVALEGFDRTGGKISAVRLRDLDGGEGSVTAPAKLVVNATGPWLDRVRALDDPSAPSLLRPTKGAHQVVPHERVGNRHAIVLHAVTDRRVLFVIPWDGQALIGTTDTDFDGDPDRVIADSSDVDYLLETVNFYFPAARLTESDVVSTFAGLRPLVAGAPGALPSALSREEDLFESPSGLLSLGGGKLTTYRRVAIRVVDRVARRLESEQGLHPRSRSGTDREPLPGGGDVGERVGGERDGERSLDATRLRFLASRYGARFREILRCVDGDPSLAEPLGPATPHLRAEARFAAETELARRVEDVLRRRTQAALRSADGGATMAETTAALMAEAVGWDRQTASQRAEEYRRSLEPATTAEARRREA